MAREIDRTRRPGESKRGELRLTREEKEEWMNYKQVSRDRLKDGRLERDQN